MSTAYVASEHVRVDRVQELASWVFDVPADASSFDSAGVRDKHEHDVCSVIQTLNALPRPFQPST